MHLGNFFSILSHKRRKTGVHSKYQNLFSNLPTFLLYPDYFKSKKVITFKTEIKPISTPCRHLENVSVSTDSNSPVDYCHNHKKVKRSSSCLLFQAHNSHHILCHEQDEESYEVSQSAQSTIFKKS